MKNKYYIEFEPNAFERQSQRGRISTRKRFYTQKIAEMNEVVESLDRLDDFSTLKIDASKYRRQDGSTYGIDVTNMHKGNEVIFPHQKEAALLFLKELRGFGLLADVVGSGKTFEAGVVISELAIRNKLRSMLLIVPDQVKASWINVMEEKFGLGKGALHDADEYVDYLDEKKKNKKFNINKVPVRTINGFNLPIHPIIVTIEDFAKWDDDTANLLFDVIVVDEAHNLCSEEGEFAKAMRLLSLFMNTKKKANFTYCLLLSATPHSGNLDHMFRLWYFIRCKGGNPKDFEEKEDKDRTETYLKEKERYHQVVCRNASTVMEFVKNVKKAEVLLNFKTELEEFLRSTNQPSLNELSEVEKNRVITEFLDRNDDINLKVTKRVASAYHNGVLRTIMIRQPNNNLLGKSKTIKNMLFFPTREEIKKINIKGLNEEDLVVDVPNLYGPKAILCDGEYFSLEDYVDAFKGSRTYQRAYAQFLIQHVLRNVDDISQDNYKNPIFNKLNTIKYYLDQMENIPVKSNMDTKIVPIQYNESDNFTYKYEQTKAILRNHKKERIIIFFDYDLKKKESLIEKFCEQIQNDTEFSKRVILGSAERRKSVVESFDKKADAILVVKDASFTEGANLQKSNIIINFQVTPDPLSMDQRIGRIFRLGQENNVTIYSLADMHKLEGYVLMYFARIGLLTSNSGDATIIAGSNNDRMVAIRCKTCKRVELYDLEDYEYRLRHDDIYCQETELCRRSGEKGQRMEEICVYDFKCATCGSAFTRSVSQEGYTCISTNNDFKGIMCSKGDQGDRKVYCRKICSIAHCSYFKKDFMVGKCPALTHYLQNRNISDLDLMSLCDECDNKYCKPECRISTGPESIRTCMDCSHANICKPRQQIISFDEKWEADCPTCREQGNRGKIKPVVARTFATYIRSSWDFSQDGGRGFCDNLLKEAKKVATIKAILDMDKLNENE